MISEITRDITGRMAKALEVAKEDFATVRTGRANPALFQKILVDYYGTPTPLGQLSAMQNLEARTLLITPYDKSALREIERAIATTPNLGVTPNNDGSVIRVTLPELTEERRKEYVKLVRTKGEEAKVAIRNIRRKGMDELAALKDEVGEDEIARAEKELEQVTRKYVDHVDEALKNKESELLEV